VVDDQGAHRVDGNQRGVLHGALAPRLSLHYRRRPAVVGGILLKKIDVEARRKRMLKSLVTESIGGRPTLRPVVAL
jgi:hypothetical protein